MDTSQFRITYDGPALETSGMDVKELAPALIAIGDLLEAATMALCGERVRPQVNVRGSFRTGSFGIDFNLATSMADKVLDLFAGKDATAIANAIAILGALGFARRRIGKGFLAVMKWLKGRRINRVEVKENHAVLYVESESLEIELDVLMLLRDVSVREAASRMLSPLSREGITIFSSGTDKEIIETVDESEIGWFDVPERQDELLLDETRRMVFSIISLAFRDNSKWRLYDGAATIHAAITDGEFLKRVDNNLVSFSKGDVLICNVHVRQWQTRDGAKTEYEVMEIIEHRVAARQIPLPGL